jgi:Ca2+-binding EF-hand superfamily protein
MGAGASAAKYETDAVSQKSVEAVRILQLLSSLGKSEAQDKVIESVSKAFADADTEKKGLDIATVKPIVEAALKEHAAGEAAELVQAIMTSVERNHVTDGLIQLAGLSSAITKKMSRSHTVRRAKGKFDELDADKSGFIDGKEIPKGNFNLFNFL